MKRISKNKILLILLITFLSCACGVRKNWKSVKNASWILQNQSIELAQNIYGSPNEVLSTKKGKNKIFIWGGEVSRLRSITTSGETKRISTEQESLNETSILKYDYSCYIALKVDENGKIIDGIQDGFVSDVLSGKCADLFLRSKEFCNEVNKLTWRHKQIPIGNCHRSDISQREFTDFVIPTDYKKGYVYQEDNFFNN